MLNALHLRITRNLHNHGIRRRIHLNENKSLVPTNDLTNPSGFQKIATFITGTLAGSLGSLVGMGGSFISIPVLTGYFKLSQHTANGTSLSSVLGTSLGGMLAYCYHNDVINSAAIDKTDSENNMETKISGFFGLPERIGNVNTTVAFGVAVGSCFASVVGAKVASKLSAKMLQLSLGTFLLCVAPIPFIKDSFKSKTIDKINDSRNSFTRSVLVGAFSGFQAGLLGVGGGAIVVPALCMFTTLGYKEALGTSFAVMFPTALTGSIAHYFHGSLNLRYAVPLGLGCFIGSYGGGMTIKGVDDSYLKYGFMGCTSILGSRILYKAIKSI